MLFGSNKLIGLDIGVSSIKLVEIEGSRGNIKLSAFGFISTPPGCVVGGEIVNADALIHALKNLIAQTNTRRKKAVVAIWGSAVISKKISIPKVDVSLLGEQLRWEAEQYIPFDIREINLQFQVLKKNPATPEQMNILLVGAKRDFVMRYAEVIESTGLNCSAIDVAGFALANTFELNYPQAASQTTMLLNIGASNTNLVVVENGEAIFARDLPFGGANYTADIQRALNISPEEAEALKISAGTGQAVPQEVTDAIQQTHEAVVEEIRRSFDFYMATATDASVQGVYITGGGIGLHGLIDHVKASLNLPVDVLNPFAKVKYSANFKPEYLSQIAPYVSIGLGLAMRQVMK